jgi:hypothetical protein
MSDTIDENAGVTPAEDPAGMTPQDTPVPGEPVVAASADEASTGVLPPAQEAPVAPLGAEEPLTAQTAAAAPQPTVAPPAPAEAPTLTQAPLAPPPRQSWIRRRWVPVVAAAAAAVLLLLGGVAVGSALDGPDDRDGQAAFGGRGAFRQDANGPGGRMDGRGMMDGRGHMDGRGQMAPGGGVNPGCDADDCPQLGTPQNEATPQPTPSISPQSL